MNKSSSHKIMDKVISPSLVGLIVLIGQFIIQPLISEKGIQKQQYLQAKQETYTEAILLINQHLLHLSNLQSKEEDDLYNNSFSKSLENCSAKLFLVASNANIPLTYLEFFLPLSENRDLAKMNIKRINFINTLRKDLYGSGIKNLDIVFSKIYSLE